jgi:hypothetical protein
VVNINPESEEYLNGDITREKKRPKDNNTVYWAKLSSLDRINYDLAIHSCKCNCKATALHDYNIVKCRMINAKRSPQERTDWALAEIERARSTVDGKQVLKFKSLDNKVLCRNAWALEQGFSISMISRLVNNDIPSYEYQGGERRSERHRLIIRDWFENVLPIYSDTSPINGQTQLDKKTYNDYYLEFKDYLVSDLSLEEDEVPSQQVWRSVWKESYKHIVIRDCKHVDSKDRVREQLKKAFAAASNVADKNHIKEIRAAFAQAMRLERMVYWRERSAAAMDPTQKLSFITDGATSTYFTGVGSIGFASGHTNLDLKLVGTKFHGNIGASLVVFDLVLPQLVSDDSNLMCTLLYNALITWQTHGGGNRSMPPHGRLQVDGVSTNWGGITFGFLEYLVRSGVFKSLNVARNPVGNTHEDIDGIFGNLRLFLMNKSWSTVDGLVKHIKDCFARAPFAVIVNVVSDVLDIKAWIQPVLDPKLSLYSRHGDCNFDPGMHALR